MADRKKELVRCVWCRQEFAPWNRGQKACSRKCSGLSKRTQPGEWRRPLRPVTPMPSPCREWQGYRDQNNYGVRYTGARGHIRAHRWVVEQVDGPLLPGEVVMHLCDNPPCFRYDHLRRATQRENFADMVAKGRMVTPGSKGEDHPNALLTDAKVRLIRSRAAQGLTQRSIAAELGVTRYTVGDVLRGRRWRHVS